MEIPEQLYKEGKPSKTPIREDANHVSLGRKRKGGEFALPTNLEKSHNGKRKTNHSGHQSDWPTGAKTCLVHGTRHSTEESKVLKEYSEKYATQRPQKKK